MAEVESRSHALGFRVDVRIAEHELPDGERRQYAQVTIQDPDGRVTHLSSHAGTDRSVAIGGEGLPKWVNLDVVLLLAHANEPIEETPAEATVLPIAEAEAAGEANDQVVGAADVQAEKTAPAGPWEDDDSVAGTFGKDAALEAADEAATRE